MILVTGGSGVIGSRVTRRLIDAGHRVRVLALPGDPANARLDDIDCDLVEGDVTRPESLAGICDGVETVFHLAAIILSPDPRAFGRVNLEGTRNVVRAALAAGVSHFVYVSSASVTYRRPTRYAKSKLAAERLVQGQQSMHWTVVRPTLVYDTNGAEEIEIFFAYLKRFPVVPFIGKGRALKRPVWADDVVSGLVAIAGNEKAYGQTYNLSGPEPMTIEQMARTLLAHHGLTRRFVHLPVALCKAIAIGMSALMRSPPLTLQAIAGVTEDADLDCAKAASDLGFLPLRFAEGLARCRPRRQR